MYLKLKWIWKNKLGLHLSQIDQKDNKMSSRSFLSRKIVLSVLICHCKFQLRRNNDHLFQNLSNILCTKRMNMISLKLVRMKKTFNQKIKNQIKTTFNQKLKNLKLLNNHETKMKWDLYQIKQRVIMYICNQLLKWKRDMSRSMK